MQFLKQVGWNFERKWGKGNKKRKANKEKQTKNRHSHTAACGWIKTRRKIATWNRFYLQNVNVKKKKQLEKL